MTKKVTITDHVERFVAMKQKLGYEFTRDAQLLRRFARFADDRNETFIRSETAVECASASTAGSQSERVRMLHTVHALACCLHAEDARHEVPPRDVLGYLSRRRPRPYLISAPDIRKLLTAALAMRPAGTIAPLTWHHLFGLIAVTGLRISEALALTLNDITPGRSRHPQHQVPQVQDGGSAPVHPGCSEPLPDGAAQGENLGRTSVRDHHRRASKRRSSGASLPRARGTNGNPKTRRGTRTDPALAAALLRCPVTREPRSRRRSEPSHAGARHLPRPRQCLAYLLVPGINPSPPARYRRGRRAGSHEWRFR